MYNKLALEIVEFLNLDPNTQLKKPIRGKSGITILSLVEALISNSSILKAGESLGYSANPLKQEIRKVLLPLFEDRHKGDFTTTSGGDCRWRLELLELINYKHCSLCNTTIRLQDFGKDKSDSRLGISSYCRSCGLAKSKQHKFYIIERTPEWCDLDKISEIYNKCPKSMVVDHIIPLRGKAVSGLHVPENLQYLSASDNMKKLNKYEV